MLRSDLLAGMEMFGIPLWNWMLAVLSSAGFFIATLCVLKLTIAFLNARTSSKSARFHGILIESLAATNRLLMGILSILIGMWVLDLPGRWNVIATHLLLITFTLQVAFWLNRAVTIWKRDYLVKRSGTNIVMATLLTTFVQAAVWVIVVLAILENAGINITALVASLGVGGVAIALAAQTILGDLFAAISIAVDKPFQVGDVITAGDISGTVEHIGLKSTHVRSLNGEQIIRSNMDLLKCTVQNFKRMTERRVVLRFNLSYRTPTDIVETIPIKIKGIIDDKAGIRFGRAHLAKLGNAALEFEAVYNVLDADYDHYMDIQQRINLDVLKLLESLGAGLAMPDGRRATFSNKLSASQRPVLDGEHRRVAH